MLASELIKELEKVIKENGDCNCMDYERNRLYDCTNLDDSLIGKRGIGKDYMREIINVVNSINIKDININDSRIRKLVSITHLTNRPFGFNTHEDGIDSSQFFYLLPEPKKTWKPYATNEEAVEAIKKHGYWLHNKLCTGKKVNYFVTGTDEDINNNITCVFVDNDWFSREELFKTFVFSDDGTPCGICVEDTEIKE